MSYDFEEHGMQIQEDVCIRCLNCGTEFLISPEEFGREEFNSSGPMGERREYIFRALSFCPHCDEKITLAQRASEYPIGCVEYVDDPSCVGGEVLLRPEVGLLYYDDAFYMPENSRPLRFYSSEKHSLDRELAVDIIDGNGYLKNEPFRSYKDQEIKLNIAGKLFQILAEETGSIRFEDNRAVFSEILQIHPHATTMRLLGKVAEAVLVRNCKDDYRINRIWLSKARKNNTPQRVADSFQAVGTGLHSTKSKYPRKYNPSDSQRDIIWINEQDECALMTGRRTTAGTIAGLQVKVSGNGINYLQKALINQRYEVPVVYFPMNNDFQRILEKVNRKGLIAEPGVDFIDVREVDDNAFYEIQDYYPLLMALVSGRISADNFVREAVGINPLRNGILAATMSVAGSDIKIIH